MEFTRKNENSTKKMLKETRQEVKERFYQKEGVVIFIIILLAISTRMVLLNNIFYMDDQNVLSIAQEKYFFTPPDQLGYRPLGNALLVMVTSLFGISEWSFRLPTFLFSVATIVLVYYYGKEMYDKKVGMLAATILSLYSWHLYGSGMNVGGEGLITFFILLCSYYFLKHENASSLRENLTLGMILGTSVLIKESSILLAPLFGIYLIFKNKSKKEIFKKGVFIGLGCVIIIALFGVIDFHFDDLNTLKGIVNNSVREGYIEANWTHQIFSLLKIVIWSTPLYCAILILWVLKKRSKTDVLERITDYNILCILAYSLFFILYLDPVFDKARYLIIITPFIAIISARFITEAGYKKNEICAIMVLMFIFLSIFLTLNINRNSISLDDHEKIMEKIRAFDYNLDIGIVSETGNSGMVVNLRIIMLTYVFVISLMILWIVLKDEEKKRKIAIIILGVTGGYCLFVSEEFLFHLTGPDYESASREIIEYARNNELTEPIYIIKNPGLIYYLEEKYDEMYVFDTIQNSDQKLQEIEELITKKQGTILMIDIPFIDKNGPLWQTITSKCVAEHTVVDKDVEIGWVFSC